MKKKQWTILLKISLLTGIIHTLSANKKKKKIHSHINNLESQFIGKWQFVEDPFPATHYIEIKEIKQNLIVYIDDKLFEGKLIELTKEKIVLQDKYGYHIILTCDKTSTYKLYDEATDRYYSLNSLK